MRGDHARSGAAMITIPDEGEDPMAFPQLTGLLLSASSTTEILDVVVDLAVAAVEGVSGASVSVVSNRGADVETSNASSDDVGDMDRAQYSSGNGPCVEAIRTGANVTTSIPSDRWPEFSRRSLAGGIRSVTSLPLTAGDATLGALNLYTRTEPGLSPAATHVARDLAAQASVVMANSAALALAQVTNDQLREALQTRDMIGQAKGIIMARQRVNAETAFDILRRGSQRTNRKLRDIAAEIIRNFGDPEVGP